MIKKIFVLIGVLMCFSSFALADEIIDSKGNIIPCKIETVMSGLIEYKKDGNKYCFVRNSTSNIFNDYVDAQTDMLKKESVVRYVGNIIVKDNWSVVIKNNNENIDIPFYKVKFVGIYKE